jgi:3-keto-5-aminohexanoate cleavage enzyme
MGMIDYARFLIDRGVLEPPHYFNFLLGSLGTLSATPFNRAAAGIGRFQLFVNSMVVTMGGNVCVGLENNLWLDAERREPATNASLVERLGLPAQGVAA